MIYKNVLEKFLKEQAMKNALEQQKQAAMQQMQMDENAMLQQTMMKAGGINIDPSKKGTFKAQATRMGMSVQEAARTILNAPEGKYSPEMRRKANFAANFAKEEGGEMIRRADGSYSQRGFWDNIRENTGSGKKPTAEMLEMERRLSQKAYGGDSVGGDCPDGYVWDGHSCVKIEVYNESRIPVLGGYRTMQEYGTSREIPIGPDGTFNLFIPGTQDVYGKSVVNPNSSRLKQYTTEYLDDDKMRVTKLKQKTRDGEVIRKSEKSVIIDPQRPVSQFFAQTFFNDGGETGSCPAGYYFDASVGDCVPIPENVNGRPSSEFNPQSLQAFLERSSQRDFDLKSAQERVLASTQSMADLEAQLQAEKQNVERKRQSIYQNAVRTVEEQERLKQEKPEQYQRARELYSGANATPATYLKSIQTMDPEILRTMPYDGRSGFIYSDPKYAGLACSSGICTVVNESGIPIGDIAGNPKLVQKLKSDPRFQVYTTEDIDPETGQRYTPLPGDIVSKTGYAPVDYRNIDLGMTVRPHDAAIVGKVLPDDNPNDAARPYLLYGNEGAALDFGANRTTLYNPSAVRKNPEETGDYGTFIRYVGGLKELRSKMSEEEALRKQYEQKLLDTEANMIVGLPTLSPKVVSSEMQVPEPQFRSFQEAYAQRLQDIENSDMSKREKKRAIKNAQETAAIIQQMTSRDMTQVRRKGGTINPVGLSKFLGML